MSEAPTIYSTTTPDGKRVAVGAKDVEHAADALLRAGHRPTVESVRQQIGRGSPNTLNPLLDQWWKDLGKRVAVGSDAFDRLPPAVVLAAETLWYTTLDETRRRVLMEQSSDTTALKQRDADLRLREHVMSLREAELQSLNTELKRQMERIAVSNESLDALYAKERATTRQLQQRIQDLQTELAAAQVRPLKRLRAVAQKTGSRVKPAVQVKRKRPHAKRVRARVKTTARPRARKRR
jgi:hypothetical protein